MSVALKHSPHPRSLHYHGHIGKNDVQWGGLIFVGLFFVIGIAFIYGLISARLADRPATEISTTHWDHRAEPMS
jgi:hypothetical protein